MKEITINIPDDSSDLVIELVERLGGSVDRKGRLNKGVGKIKNKPKKKLTLSNKKPRKIILIIPIYLGNGKILI